MMAELTPTENDVQVSAGQEETLPDFAEIEAELRQLIGEDTYSELENYGGLPPEELWSSSYEIVSPEASVTYDAANGWLNYQTSDGNQYQASVPSGMVSTVPVTIHPIKNAYVTVTRNGSRMEIPEDGYYRQEGLYHMQMLALPNTTADKVDTNFYQSDFYFRIIPEVVSRLDLICAPAGFKIERMELDGRQIPLEHADWEMLHQDGYYRIGFVDQDNGTTRFYLTFTRDTTAPLMSFTPSVGDRVPGPVQIRQLDPDARMQTYFERAAVTLSTDQLVTEGEYLFQVTDQVGNERFYTVELAQPAYRPEINTVIIITIVAAVLLFRILWQRRHMRFL